MSGYVLGMDPGQQTASPALTLLVGLDPADTSRRAPWPCMNIVLVKVRGPLSTLCKEELLFGDQIAVQGFLRSRSFRKASGALCIVQELDALTVIPLHPDF